MSYNLQKLDLYHVHQMNKDFDGGCYSIDLRGVTVNEGDVYKLLDEACTLCNLHSISTAWRKLNYEDAKQTLQWGFQNDLAYGGTRLGKKKTNKYLKLILDHFNAEDTRCFTNWENDPWREGNSNSWFGVSQNTFDIAVVVFDKETLVMTYLTSED